MRIWYAALVVLCCVLAGGCRTNQHIAALQRDNRLKEDEIYRLRWQLEDCQEDLDRHLHTQHRDADSSPVAAPARTILDRLGAPAAPVESAAPVAPVESVPYDLPVEIGEPMTPDEFRRPQDVQKPLDGPVLPFPEPADEVPSPTWPEAEDDAPGQPAPLPSTTIPPQQEGQPSRGIPPEREAARPRTTSDSRHVAHMQIDASATGGHRYDQGQPGYDGLSIVLELLDEDDRPIRAPAEVSIVLLDPDPSLQGDAARVARWDFTADEVAAAIRASEGHARGIPLKVVWREKAPQNEHLHLFVRYTTAEGRKFEDQVQLRISLPGTSDSSGWRTAPRASPPPPPSQEEDRATSQPEPPDRRTRVASRSLPAPAAQPDPAPQPRRSRPQWSPDRP